MIRWSPAVGGVFALLAVVFGAFGAHGLEGRLDAHMLEVFKTGASYQMVHAIALICVGSRAQQGPACRLATAACILFMVGILLFSGSLYVLALTGVRALGAVAPLGGLCFMAGWAVFIAAEVSAARAA